jgi:hypothetical protein
MVCTNMRAAVALLVTLTMTTAGCFPHNEKHRTYAKIGEGTALVAGIAISAFANTGADCDEDRAPGVDNEDCRSGATALSTIGVALILVGLLGFVATVSTAEDEDKTSTKIKEVTPDPVPPATTTTPPAETAPTTPTEAPPAPDTGSATPPAP